MDEPPFSWANLPEACIANILSFTSPRDACRVSLVSSTFRSAADSDAVWDCFLPPDYPSIISQSCTTLPSSFSSKKHLFLTLSDKPLLIDEGLKSFLVDKLSGKKCYMLSARSLFIVWGDTRSYWRWNYDEEGEARFEEVAELVAVCWLEMVGWINTRMLSPSTLYVAYLVFKISDRAYGFEHQPVEVSVGIVGADNLRRTVYLHAERGRRVQFQIIPRPPIFNPPTPIQPRLPIFIPTETQNLRPQYPNHRPDGWLEIEMGDFFNEGADDEDLEMGVYEVKGGNWKGGLIVQGFEIRPKLK